MNKDELSVAIKNINANNFNLNIIRTIAELTLCKDL